MNADFIINFCISRGVSFKTAPEYEAIIPGLLKRIWEVENNKESVLWEMFQQGGVSGDCFVKVAWEPQYVDDAGFVHEGRVRILPLNSAYCYPEWHPHDRDRLMRFKLKYRFWGCVDTQTEALTRNGWKSSDQLSVGDEILSLDPETDEITWKPVKAVNIYNYDGHMVQWSNHINAVTTPNHRWLAEIQHGRGTTTRYEREIVRTEIGLEGDKSIRDLRKDSRIIVGGGTPLAFSDSPKFSDEFVETLAWFVCEGSWHRNQSGYLSGNLAQSERVYPEKTAQIRRLAAWWKSEGATFTEAAKPKNNGVVNFYLGKGVTESLHEIIGDEKNIPASFLTSLTYSQAVRFYETLIDADGCRTHGSKNTVRWTQLDEARQDSFQMLAAMLGKRSVKTSDGEKVQVYDKRHILAGSTRDNAKRVYLEDGKVWCPTVEGGIWFARRGGSTFWTGNTSPEGTRQVFTYTEIITDDWIEEYVNDELIDQRQNPLGVIPIVHIPNTRISGSPWGLSDIADILSLNREYNEKMMEISDIINYSAAPVTIITGARASNLEKGPKKVWSLPSEKASAFNLAGGTDSIPVALEYVESIKRSMHELTGVPESALGQMQPISNTSGVALSIMYTPLMQRYHQKKMTYSVGLRKINEFILKTSFVMNPISLIFDPTTEGVLKEGQQVQIDPEDPLAYQTEIHWPPPLPIDKLITLQELQQMMAMGLESKKGALAELGYEFPEEKLQEIFQELVQDKKFQGALDMVEANIAAAIFEATGMIPGGEGNAPTQGDTPDTQNSGGTEGTPQKPQPTGLSAVEAAETNKMLTELVTQAYGTKLPSRRNPDEDTN